MSRERPVIALVAIDDGCDGCGAVNVRGVCFPAGKAPRPVLCEECVRDAGGALPYLKRTDRLFQASHKRDPRRGPRKPAH